MASKKNGSGEVNIGPAYEKEVAIDLSNEELEDYKQKHLAACNDLEKAQAEKSDAMSVHNKELKTLRATERDLRSAINTGSTKLKVKVEDHMIFRTQTVVTKRKDNGEVVDERPMTAEERQTKMFAEPEKGSDGSSATVGDITAARAAKKSKNKGSKGAGADTKEQPEAT